MMMMIIMMWKKSVKKRQCCCVLRKKLSLFDTYYFDIFNSGTFGDDMRATPLVNDTRAHLTLIALCVEHAPYKIATNRTKRRLSKVSGHELVSIDLMHLASQCNSSSIERLSILLEHFIIGVF
jgi:hypothetical protein